ncbi:TonB-dependent receptor [Pelomonas sp. SE-A7]|uniref:TonB-dependent receptor n=1 Tax=Pelomonas sp. SE-A7 TaxID=3054953 RepID=UPI00259D1A0A|nr:TonB-dependent receptor [Pelomonas sp. SE-A7]MDM4767297.1 TonB-dependent receptor [Pelomonas sp. SE-A7]
MQRSFRAQPRLNKLAACLLGSTSLMAAAQTAPTPPAAAASSPEAKSQQLETVVVTGLRGALESALRKKRDETGIVDVIKAEDIGKFPDTNLAESLQRIPGVVIDRDAGEGRQITVRGLGGDFTRTRINGIEGQTSTGGTDSSGGSNKTRTMDFNVFASELFNSVTLRKSSAAEVDEGSLGAVVDLQTTRPFDLKGFTLAGSLKGSYNDLSGKTTPRAAFLISDTLWDRKVGWLLSGAFSKRSLLEEGFSTVRWDNGVSSGGWCPPQGATIAPGTTLPAGSTATTCGPAAQGVNRLPNTTDNQAAYLLASNAANFHPRLPRYGRLTHEQDRMGITGSIQVRPSENTLVTFDMLYSKLKATRQEDFLEAISFSRTLAQGGKPQTSVVETQYDAAGRLLYGKYNGVDVRAESRFDKLSTVYTQPTLTLEHDISDSLKFTGIAGRADSKFKNPIQTTTTLDVANVNGYTIDFRNSDRLPSITYPFDPATTGGSSFGILGVPTGGATALTNGTASEIRIRPQGTNNRNDVLNLNLAWEVVPDKLTIKGGTSFKKYSFESYESRRAVETMYAPPAGTALSSLTTMVSGFGKGQSLPAGTITSWAIPDLNAIASLYDIYCNCLKSGAAGGPGDFTLASITNGNARGNNRAIVEYDRGAFLQADFRTRMGDVPMRGNIGARLVRTEVIATGYLATGGGTPVTVSNQYEDMLPSLNLTAELNRELNLRFGAAKAMTRPPLQLMNPGGTISTTGNLSITTGNPNLLPFRSTNVDLGIEWYFAKNALFGIGAFYKDIDSYIQTSVQTVKFNDTGLPKSLLPANFTGDEQFALSSSFNTPGGKLKGIELNYQQPFTFLPGFAKNFGALLNYTYVTSKIAYFTSATSTVPILDDLVNMSPRAWNASLYYDDGTFTARVSYSNRSTYLTRVPGQNNNDVEGKNGTKNVDMTLSYKVNKQLELTLEGVNLTNQANDQFISRARNSVVVNNVTGREYMVGARYKF